MIQQQLREKALLPRYLKVGAKTSEETLVAVHNAEKNYQISMVTQDYEGADEIEMSSHMVEVKAT